MKIGVIADTHQKQCTEKFLLHFNKLLKNVDLLIHAGDFTDLSILEYLKEHSNFVGVWGNADTDAIKALIKEKEIIQVEGYRIGIFHGHGNKKTTLERVHDKFKEDSVDLIIYGHSHQPCVNTKNGILMLNPGSLLQKRREKRFSYILLDLNQHSISVQMNLIL